MVANVPPHGASPAEPARTVGLEPFLLRYSQTGLLIYSGQGSLQSANEDACRLLGRPLKELRDKTTQEMGLALVRADGSPLPPSEYPSRQALATLMPVRDVVLGIDRGGAEGRVWVLCSAFPETDGGGQVTRVVVTLVDFTEHMRAEAVLRQRIELQRQLEKLALTVPGAIYTFRLRADGSVCLPFSTPIFEDLWGLKPEELRDDASGLFATIHPDDVEEVRESIARSADTMETWHKSFRVLHPYKGEVWLEANSVAEREDDGCVVWHGFVQDVTKRKVAEESAQEALSMLDAALESTADAVFICDTEGRFLKLNDAFVTFHRFNNRDECPKELTEFTALLDVFLPNGEPARWDDWVVPRALRGEVRTSVEYSLRRKDTGEAWEGSYSFAPIRGVDGAIVGSVVVGRDITEQKRAEQALRESEERFLTAFRASPACQMISTMITGKILDVNTAFCRLMGYQREEILGRSVVGLKFYPDPKQRAATFADFEREGHIRDQELTFRTRGSSVQS